MNKLFVVSITGVVCSMLLTLGMIDSATAGGKKKGGCRSTAKTLYKACYYDVGDDYQTVRANCTNLADRDERNECYQDARSELRPAHSECRDQYSARRDACEILAEDVYDPDPLLDPANQFINPDDVPGLYYPNPYVSIQAGHTFVLSSEDEIVVVTVTDDIREIQGVSCRVVVDVVVEEEEDGGTYEYEPIEVTDDWFAQDTIGNVYYCGEIARNYEDGVLRDLDGSFEAGLDYAKSGELIRIAPAPGDVHRQEFALGEAEDIIQYEALSTAPSQAEGGDNESFPCAPDLCLKTFEFAPLEPSATEFKYYLPDTGFVLAVGLEDGELTGEREELVCIGDSLDILSDPTCGIGDPVELLDELCDLAPDAFCDNDADED